MSRPNFCYHLILASLFCLRDEAEFSAIHTACNVSHPVSDNSLVRGEQRPEFTECCIECTFDFICYFGICLPLPERFAGQNIAEREFLTLKGIFLRKEEEFGDCHLIPRFLFLSLCCRSEATQG